LDSDFFLERLNIHKTETRKKSGNTKQKSENARRIKQGKERREERNEPILCYVLLHTISAERDGTIDWNVYRQERTSQDKHCRLVCLFVCLFQHVWYIQILI
jgi:hypothetical protein